MYVVGRDGREIPGLSRRKDGRYYATHSKDKRSLGTDFDAALVKFREWEARQRKEFVSLPAERPDRRFFGGRDFQRAPEGAILYDPGFAIPTEPYDAMVLSEDFWALVGRAIRENPHLAAEKTGLPLTRLHLFKEPGESVPLSDIGSAYLNRPEAMSYQYKHDTTRYWNEFVGLVGEKATVADVSAEDVRRYRDKIHADRRSGDRAVHYVRSRFTAIRTVLNYAYDLNLDAERIGHLRQLCRMLKAPAVEDLDPDPIGVDEYHALLNGASKMMKAVLLLALNCAFYPGEVAVVPKKAINETKKTFVDKRPKTKVYRVAVLWGRTLRAVRAHMKESPSNSPALFLNRTKRPCTARNIADAFRSLRKQVGLPDTVLFEQIRDGAVTAAIDGGADALQAKILAGHKVGISDAYLKRNPRMVANACRAIEKHYFG